ncbi:MAG: DUF1553 domain-containing protein [Bacteroidota bacterium]
MRYYLLLILPFFWACGNTTDPAIADQLPEIVDFNFHIRPLLSDRCYACHGPDAGAREAGLRLDTEAGAFAVLTENPGHYALVGGKLDQSEVYHRIYHKDPELLMPPPESNLVLTEVEKALISRWIEQGAKWKDHWAFIPPQANESSVPRSDAHPIDAFVSQSLQKRKLKLSPEASKAVLIRRLSLDLTGLPPSVAELDAFVADSSPEAYERVVDRLLGDDAFGERLAAEWLDLARYADSHGFQDDGMRNMWPWRDWVIQAFNKNLPYDQFVSWQLAGDLLPKPSQEQLLATGFNRNHMQSQEGGIVEAEFRTEYTADRVQTFSKAFLGLTMECARCHDHKYDPLSQKEYYQLFAFFNNVNEYGQIPYSGEASPTIILTDDEIDQKRAFLWGQIDSVEHLLDPQRAEYQNAFASWQKEHKLLLKERNLIEHFPLDKISSDSKTPSKLHRGEKGSIRTYAANTPPKIVAGKVGKAFQMMGDNYVDFGNKRVFFERNQPFSVSLWFKVLADSVEGPIFGRSGGLMDGNRGYDCMLRADRTLTASLNHVWPDNAIEIETTAALPLDEWVLLTFTYDGSSRAEGLRLYANDQLLPSHILNNHLEQSIKYPPGRGNWYGDTGLWLGRRFESSIDQVAFDELKVYDACLTPLEVAWQASQMDESQIQSSTNSAPQQFAYYLATANDTFRLRQNRLAQIRGEENELISQVPEMMIMRDRPADRPRATFMLNRGAYDQPIGEAVSVGTPAYVLPWSDQYPQNRLGLAQWLFDDQNPLTARVAVNRYWQMLFGRGLVASSDDFGNQGDLPSHPDLLDWLANEFRHNGWDTKALLKTIVMSQTYRQTSFVYPELYERDPDNVWLARGPSFRLSAEMVRDQALAASGLLVDSIGGPSVYPYQPAGLWAQLATRNATKYVPQSGDSLYRRGLYTIWKRTTPPPSMINFDASERNFCTVKRQRTSTPLQALVLLNDPQYVEASRQLAARMMREGGTDIAMQLDYGFKLMTGRSTRKDELSILQTLWNEQMAFYKAKPLLADSLIQIGESPKDTLYPPAMLAATTIVASTIMNSDAAIIRR